MSALAKYRRWALGLVVLLLGTTPAAQAQTGAESSVGYVDSALPMNMVRLRFDAAYDNNHPDRAEFFYPQFRLPGISPFAPGPPLLERRVDFQEIGSYIEILLQPTLSGFIEVPVRFVNPHFNSNAGGLSDIVAGFKWAYVYTPAQVCTFALRGYFPSGNAAVGLGTHHVSVEPELLWYRRLSERWTFEAELRDWIAVGGTDFAGNVLRYGAGVSFLVVDNDWGCLAPVTELVGWTVLSGKQFDFPTGAIQDVAGNTIVNAKFGVRMTVYPEYLEGIDFYIGYGRALTGTVWYEDIVRTELRLRF
jgi:hypothetical protein